MPDDINNLLKSPEFRMITVQDQIDKKLIKNLNVSYASPRPAQKRHRNTMRLQRPKPIPVTAIHPHHVNDGDNYHNNLLETDMVSGELPRIERNQDEEDTPQLFGSTEESPPRVEFDSNEE